MPQYSYPFAVSRVKSAELKMLSQQDMDRLDGLSTAEALKALRDTGYGEGAVDKSGIASLSDAELEKVRSFIEEITPDKELTDLFLMKHDAHNIKTVFKSKLLGVEPDGLAGYAVTDTAVLKECADTGDWSGLSKPGGKLKEILADFESDRNAGKMSAAVDRMVYGEIVDAAKKSKNEFIIDFVKNQVDCANINAIFRAKRLDWSVVRFEPMVIAGGYLEPGKLLDKFDSPDAWGEAFFDCKNRSLLIAARDGFVQNGDADETEELLNEHMLGVANAARFDSFGFGPIAGYILTKENEARRLRVLFARKSA